MVPIINVLRLYRAVYKGSVVKKKRSYPKIIGYRLTGNFPFSAVLSINQIVFL
jgi:hypothetical protein